MKISVLTSFIAFALILSACANMGSEKSVMEDKSINMKDYLIKNNIDAKETESGLLYTITEEGDGTHPTVSDSVTVHYHGYTKDGQVFDSSVERGEPLSFNLTQVIVGWQEGIPLLSKGGKGVLYVPSNLAYGERGIGPIKPNTDLIFEVELIDFVKR